MRSLLPGLFGLVGLLAAACGGGARDVRSSTGSPGSPFTVAIEGRCPKLRVHDVGQRTLVVVGTYGLDEAGAWTGRQTAHAAQALALVEPIDRKRPASPRTATMNPSLLDGLPRTSTGWAEGDLDVGGQFPSGVWLERTLRTPAAPNKGALFETSHDGFTWAGSAWRRSSGRDGLLRGAHTTLPTASTLCPGDEASVALSLLASERTADGTTFVAGRCEDELHRPEGPLLLGRYDVRTHVWQRIPAPASVLFEGREAIVNAGIIAVSPDEAWIWAYRPFTESERERAYLVHFDGTPTLVDVPFARSIVSLARSLDGSLLAVAGFSELRRMDPGGHWDPAPITMPPLGFVEPAPPPGAVRLLEVQAVGKDVWVHGAIPIVRDDGSASREHLLYTTAPWATPLHCDRDRPPQTALTAGTVKVKLGVTPKRAPLSEQEQAAR
ncbi:hypothetical protein BH11MYX4_BH11MYX4_08050 [soil metagenome]